MRFNLAERILNQDVLSKDEALALFEDETIDTFELLNEAYIIRKHFSGKSETQYDIKCEKWNLFRRLWLLRSIGENEEKQRYALVEPDKIKAGAQVATENHIGTYCIVMSGRGPTNREVDHICETVHDIKVLHPQLKICACLGLTNEEQAEKLKEAGVDRYNHNLNTSERYHNEVVTTHTYEDRVRTVEIMKANHISPCSGVICGMGETNEDIIDMAFALREIDADSIPINFLHPIKGTKFGDSIYCHQ